MKKNSYISKPILIVFLTLLILTPGFYRNQWLAAGKQWFYDWRKIQEGMVIARIVESRETGVLSHGGLLGFGCAATSNCDWESFDLDQGYMIYRENGRFQSYSPYTSHPGLQGVIFSLFELATNFSPSLNLRLFHGAISLLSAFVLGLFIYWIFKELGAAAGSLTLMFIALSEWMTLFSGNIFWNIWAFYLPLVISSLYLMNNSSPENYKHTMFSIMLVIAMYIKCLFTGFEYITTALVMSLMPFVFYAVRDSWKCSRFLMRSLHASLSLLTGVVAGLLTLIWQIIQVKEGFREAVTTILDAFGKRSIGDPTQYVSEADSLKAGLFPVLIQYINGRAILLRQIIPIKDFSIEISYSALFLLFASLTVLLATYIMRSNIFSATRASSSAIIITTWISVLAPLSWFIIFKAHSYVHTQMNFIIWQMPFTLYGFALCGYTIGLFIDLVSIKKLPRSQ